MHTLSIVCYLFGFLLPALDFLLLGFPLLLDPLLQQGQEVAFLLTSSVKLLPGHLQLSSQGLYLFPELTLLLLITPLEDKAQWHRGLVVFKWGKK